MTQDIAVIQPRHRHLRDDHLEEGRERREHAKLVSFEAKPGSRRKIGALHDARWNEHLGVLLVDYLQARRAFEIAYKQIR
jgi:hypothetical protein